MESEQRNLLQIKKIIIIICNKGSLEIMLELVVQFFPRKPTCTLHHSATAAPCFLSYLSCQQWIMFLFVGLSVRLSLRDAFSMCNSLQCFQLFSPKNRTHIRTRSNITYKIPCDSTPMACRIVIPCARCCRQKCRSTGMGDPVLPCLWFDRTISYKYKT